MARTSLGGGLAALLLLAATGCHTTDVISLGIFQSGPNGEHVIVLTGSVDSVVQIVQGKLQQLGFMTETSRRGDEVRIACSSAKGGKFYLVLSKTKTKEGEKTRVRLDWEGSADKEAGVAVLAQLTAEVVTSKR